MTERHRPELQVHCYRMLGSFTDAEDHVQETLLGAWRQRSSFAGRSPLRTWLYRIATNACLDTLRRDPPRVVPVGVGTNPSPSEIRWLEPNPDRLLDRRHQPRTGRRGRRQRDHRAGVPRLDPTAPAQSTRRADSARRAWLVGQRRPPSSSTRPSRPQTARCSERARECSRTGARGHTLDTCEDPRSRRARLTARYIEAHHRADTGAVVEMLCEEVRFTMPPQPVCYLGVEQVGDFWARYVFGSGAIGDFRLVKTRANPQPAATNYVRSRGETDWRATSLDVMRFVDGRIAGITTFEPHLFEACGLPAVL